MSKAKNLVLELEKKEKTEPRTLQPYELGGANILTRRSTQLGVNRQYVPSETLQVDNVHTWSSGGQFRKLIDFFQFNHGPSLPRSNATVDLLVTIFCFAAVHYIYIGTLDFTSQRAIVLFSSLLFTILSLYLGGTYNKSRLRSFNSEISNLILCGICAFAIVGLFAFLTKTAAEVSRVWITASMVLSLLSLASVRVFGSLGFLVTSKVKTKNVMICGFTPNIKSVMHSLYKLPNSRIRVAKIFELSSELSTVETRTSDYQENPAAQVAKFIESQRQSGNAIEEVWIAMPASESHNVEDLSDSLVNSSVDVCVVPDFYTERLIGGDVNRYGDSKTINISEISLSPSADRFKRMFDFVFAIAALLIFCIPMAIIALLIKMESSGSPLFRQKRYGVDGQEIDVLKFRSMYLHDDSQVRQATRNDARVTRIGKILRSTSLDELPQLLNVLNGSMSLVGPRPHAVAHNEKWRKQIKGYMLRHKVKPGITGWAQVHGWRGETDTAFKMQQRVNHDLEYIRRWSPWLDIKILFMTVVVGFRAENAY